MSQFHRPSQYKAGLGHGSLRRIHQKNDAVDHFQDPFHFAAEIRVAGGVHNIDLHPLIHDRSVLGENGDPPLPLQISRVHDPLLHHLIFVVFSALLEQLVYQGRFSMVYMGDNRDVSQIFPNHAAFLSFDIQPLLFFFS